MYVCSPKFLDGEATALHAPPLPPPLLGIASFTRLFSFPLFVLSFL